MPAENVYGGIITNQAYKFGKVKTADRNGDGRSGISRMHDPSRNPIARPSWLA